MIYIDGPDNNGGNYYAIAPPGSNPISYSWSITPSYGCDLYQPSSSSNFVQVVPFQGGSYTLKVTVTTDCGVDYGYKNFYSDLMKSSPGNIFYPNPVDDVLYVDLSKIANPKRQETLFSIF